MKWKASKNTRRPVWMNKKLLDKLKTQKGSLQRVEEETESLGGIQRDCLSRQELG